MPDSLFCLSVINNAGNMLAGFSSSGQGNWSHYQTLLGSEPPTPGFVEIEELATKQSVSIAGVPGGIVMAFLGHSSNEIFFASSVDGTAWSQHPIGGFHSNVPPAIFAMPYAPTLLLTYINPGDNEIMVATSDDSGATWNASRTGQTSKSAPAVIYTANVAGGSFSSTNFYFLMLFQSDDNNNNLLAATSSDAISWQPAPGIGQQSPCAPSVTTGIPNDGGTNFTMAFVANDPSNRILLASSVGGVSWGGAVDTGHRGRGTPQLININGVLFLVFLGLNDDNIYSCRSSDGVNWSETQVCPGFYPPGASGFSAQPPPTLTPPVTVIREGGLKSDKNYYFYDGGRPLRNVSVEIVITEDIPMPPAGQPGSGISFQVNCYSPANDQPQWKDLIVGWQQYDTHVSTHPDANSNPQTDVFFRINNWSQQKSLNFSLDDTSPRTYLPSQDDKPINKLPAHSRFVTTLENDADDNVSGVTFTAYAPDKSIVKQWTQQLVGLETGQKTKLTPQQISPIIAFQVDFVASNGHVVLSGGAGTIKCSAWNLMTVEGKKPANASGPPTGEGANSTYGTLTNVPSTVFTQTFGVS